MATVRNNKSPKKKETQIAETSVSKHEGIEVSSGNVFADIDLPDAEALIIKSQLAIAISELIEQKGWTQTEIARRLDNGESMISNLLRGKLSSFSTDKLFVILNRLGHDVEVRISAKEEETERTHTRVTIC